MADFPEDGNAQAGDGPVEDGEVDDGLKCDARKVAHATEGREEENEYLGRDSIPSLELLRNCRVM